MSAPLITVLMAVYNGEKCLDHTIESILSQTFTDFEFLIINDCSTDRTADVIRSYNDARIRLHSNETNIGQTKSLNVGLNLAKGKYIARMDADDYSMPNRLERQYHYITQHPEYSVVGTDCLVMDESNAKRSISKGYFKYEDIIIKLLTGSPINHVSVLMNRADIVRIGAYDPKYKISADFDLWSRLIRQGYKITTLREVLCAYRVSEGSYSNRNEARKVKENTDIIFENIRYISNYVVNRESVKQLICRFSDEFVNMSDQEILKAERVYRNIITNLKSELRMKIEKSRIKKILLTNYLIAAYHYILNKKSRNARDIIRLCIRNHGVTLYSLATYSLTYLNIGTIKKLNYLRAKFIL
ncbi:MAG: glycosyltransferase [Deltaproteobacteria bacterium]|nr:glycosyltransferase [Deltaproteobacteria bacterium]